MHCSCVLNITKKSMTIWLRLNEERHTSFSIKQEQEISNDADEILKNIFESKSGGRIQAYYSNLKRR